MRRYEWDPNLFRGGKKRRSVTYHGLWNDERSFLSDLAENLNIRDQEGWYQVTPSIIKKHGGNSLLLKYNGSLRKLLVAACPEYLSIFTVAYSMWYQWDSSKFSWVPFRYDNWDTVTKQRAFMEDLASQLHIRDWSHITSTSLHHHGGGGLLKKYGSLSKLLASLYPEYTQTCKDAVHQVMQELKVNQVKDLLHVSTDSIKSHAAQLLQQHDNSVTKCKCTVSLTVAVLATCFPEMEWDVPRRQKHVPFQGYWKDGNNQKQFLDSLATTLCILY